MAFTNPRARYHRFDILAISDATSDTFGESTQAPSVIAQVWGSLEPKGSREYWQAQQLQSDTTHVITIAYQRDLASLLSNKNELRKGTRLFNTTASPINVDEANREWMLEVKEKQVLPKWPSP